jgi:hypothetical protein
LRYALGTFQGALPGAHTQIHRSGLLDSGFRLTVNLKGGLAMQPNEFVKRKQAVFSEPA